MGEHTAIVEWTRGDQGFADGSYSRAHDWTFDGGAVVRGSSAPPVPHSDPTAVDPEEAVVAALSSCHMLFFLAFAAKAGLTVDRYRDEPVAELGRDERGRTSLLTAVLRPRIIFSGEQPDAAVIAELHERSHRYCYIANSLRTEVRVEPQ